MQHSSKKHEHELWWAYLAVDSIRIYTYILYKYIHNVNVCVYIHTHTHTHTKMPPLMAVIFHNSAWFVLFVKGEVSLMVGWLQCVLTHSAGQLNKIKFYPHHAFDFKIHFLTLEVAVKTVLSLVCCQGNLTAVTFLISGAASVTGCCWWNHCNRSGRHGPWASVLICLVTPTMKGDELLIFQVSQRQKDYNKLLGDGLSEVILKSPLLLYGRWVLHNCIHWWCTSLCHFCNCGVYALPLISLC